MKAYQDAFPPDKRFPSPSLLATGYHNAATAAFTVLDAIGGDLSDGHEKLRAGLAALELDAPNGMIRLDGNRQAIGTNFVTEVVEDADGNLVNRLVRTAAIPARREHAPEILSIGRPGGRNRAGTPPRYGLSGRWRESL